MSARRRCQHGAAVLSAMLTVALVSTLAAGALWSAWRSTEIEAAERSRTQMSWVLTGALDWARLILQEDGRKGGADHLGEPWAVPLEPARLSTFLAADRSDAIAADATQEAFLAGHITDLQGLLNVRSLVQDGKLHAPSYKAFERLFRLLELPLGELDTLAGQLRVALDPKSDPTDSAVSLVPQEFDQLVWLGLSPASLARLRPYVTVLPLATPVNLNTAPEEVIYASAEALDLADAHRLVAARSTSPLQSLSDAARLSGNALAQFNGVQHSVSTRFFCVRGVLRVESFSVVEESVVQRDGMVVKTLSRKRVSEPVLPLTMTAGTSP